MWPWLSAKNKTSGRNLRRDEVLHLDDRARPGATVVPQLAEALPRIAVEFERARRYGHTVTIAVFTLASDDPNTDRATGGNGGDDSTAQQACLTNGLAPLVRQVTREVDLVTHDPSAQWCIVVMPEIGADEGRQAVSRVRQLCAGQVAGTVRADIAVFPNDGWVFLDLVDVAQRHARTADRDRLVPVLSGTA